MKDTEFIALLNLYLDHEITPADAARLEAEVLGNPARRHVYQEYCRMQKACTMLAQEFQTEAAPIAEGNVVAFEPASRRKTRRAGFYVAGGFAAAAACLAFIFAAGNRHGDTTPGVSQDAIVQAISPSASSGGAVAAAPASRAVERRIGRTVTIPETAGVQATLVNSLTLAGKPAAGSTSLLSSSEQTGAQFEWINSLQLAPVQRVSIEEFRFDANSPLRRDERSYVSPRMQQGAMEWNAIRYQK